MASILYLFWPPCSMWGSRGRDQIQAAVATYTTASAILVPLTCCAGPGMEPAFCCRDTAYPAVPQWETSASFEI